MMYRSEIHKILCIPGQNTINIFGNNVYHKKKFPIELMLREQNQIPPPVWSVFELSFYTPILYASEQVLSSAPAEYQLLFSMQVSSEIILYQSNGLIFFYLPSLYTRKHNSMPPARSVGHGLCMPFKVILKISIPSVTVEALFNLWFEMLSLYA
jgi:hypothetical protein